MQQRHVTGGRDKIRWEDKNIPMFILVRTVVRLCSTKVLFYRWRRLWRRRLAPGWAVGQGCALLQLSALVRTALRSA